MVLLFFGATSGYAQYHAFDVFSNYKINTKSEKNYTDYFGLSYRYNHSERQIQVNPVFVFDLFIDDQLFEPMAPLVNFALGPMLNCKLKGQTIEPYFELSPCLKYTIRRRERFWNSGVYMNVGILVDKTLKLGVVNHYASLKAFEPVLYHFGFNIGIQFKSGKKNCK